MTLPAGTIITFTRASLNGFLSAEGRIIGTEREDFSSTGDAILWYIVDVNGRTVKITVGNPTIKVVNNG